MKLTQQEKLLILEKRKEEESNAPKLIGTLKEDLYCPIQEEFELPWIMSKTKRDYYINNMQANFKLAVKAGAKFVAFVEDDGAELWFEDDENRFGIENMSSEWAREHLTNIKPIKKVKK
jgi:hypothetical protein